MKVFLPLVLLLFLDFRLEAAPVNLDSQLLQATKKGDVKIVQSLLKRGAHVNAHDANGTTSLMLAAQGGNAALMYVLLKSGADVRARDKWGFSCLGYAPLCVEQLLKCGARATRNDAAALSDWLENDIWIDSDTEDDDVRAETKLLLRAGMNLNTQGFDENGTTPLLNAVDSRPSLVPFLLSLGADPNVPYGIARTPLIAALSPLNVAVNDSVALALLSRGAKVNTRDPDGETALILAANANRLALAHELIARGANLDIRNKQGRTALMRAATGGFTDMARLLLSSGAQPDLKDTKGQTALDFAKSREFVYVSIGITASNKEAAQEKFERELKGRVEIQELLEARAK